MKQEDDSTRPPSPKSFVEKIKHWWRPPPSPDNKNDLLRYLNAAASKHIITTGIHEMIEGVIDVTDLRARDIMVPRYQMTAVPHEADFQTLLTQVIEPGFSRYPVVGENRDEILGILLAKDLLGYCLAQQQAQFNLMDQIRPVFFVPESKRLNALLKEFRTAHTHMAIVFNEHGGVAGLVTIEDVLEQIVGEIEDEHDIPEELSIKKLGHHQYMVSALTPVATINEYFNAQMDTNEFDTIGGLVTHQLGHLPKRGETLTLGHLNVKVAQSTSRRIQYLLVNDSSKTNS